MSAPTVQSQYDTLTRIAQKFDRQAGNSEKMARHHIQILEQLEGGSWEWD